MFKTNPLLEWSIAETILRKNDLSRIPLQVILR